MGVRERGKGERRVRRQVKVTKRGVGRKVTDKGAGRDEICTEKNLQRCTSQQDPSFHSIPCSLGHLCVFLKIWTVTKGNF